MDSSWFCAQVIRCSIDPGESSSAIRMKAVSGIIVISWLSFLPSSAPGGLDSASAAMCTFPGV